MAYDEHLADKVRDALEARTAFNEIKMFGGLCFTERGNMAVGVVNSDLMVRVGADAYDSLLSKPGARPMDFTKSTMKGFLFIGPDGWRTRRQLESWIDASLAYTSTLPPKAPKKRKTPMPRAGAKGGRR